MPAFVIAKKFHFDAGHRLAKGYSGKCANIHGHRYEVEVRLFSQDLNHFNMVFDFTELAYIKQWLDDTFDHNLLLWKGDPLLEHLRAMDGDVGSVINEGIFVMDLNPTAEHIADVIFKFIRPTLPDNIALDSVRVWETPNCWAAKEL